MACGVPSGAIKQQGGMCALGNMAGYFFEMQLHGLGVSLRQGKSRACAASRANGTKQIGVGIALICGLARSRSSPGPLSHDAVLLADTRLILEPDLNSRCNGNALQMGLQRVSEVFLKAAIVSASCPGC